MAMFHGIDYTLISWRAWYANGRIYDSGSTCWEDLPEHGFLRANMYYRTRPYIKKLQGKSVYWVERTGRGLVYCFDDSKDAIISDGAKREQRVKYGKWVTDNEWEYVRALANAALVAPNEHERIDRIR